MRGYRRGGDAARLSRAPFVFRVGQNLVHHQTVQRCVERALAYGALAAIDDRPRPGKGGDTPEARPVWCLFLATRGPRSTGHPRVLWPTRLLGRAIPRAWPAGRTNDCLAHLVQGTLCKLLGQDEIKPHMCATIWNATATRARVSSRKMAEGLCIYREGPGPEKSRAKSKKKKLAGRWDRFLRREAGYPGPSLNDTAPDCRKTVPWGLRDTARDYEYKLHDGTLELLVGPDRSAHRKVSCPRQETPPHPRVRLSNSSSFSDDWPPYPASTVDQF